MNVETTTASSFSPGASRAPLDVLRGVTRQMSTAENFETVLRSITTALVERADAAVAHIFLYLYDHECRVCRERTGARCEAPGEERSLHLVAAAGHAFEITGPFHKIPNSVQSAAAVLIRSRTPVVVQNPLEDDRWRNEPGMGAVMRQLDIKGIVCYPLDLRGEAVGAIGYLTQKPVDTLVFELLGIFADQAAMAIKSAQLFDELQRYKARLEDENAYLQDELRAEIGFDDIVGESLALRAVLRKVRQVSSVETTVLLTGETGTGKELIARAVHGGSARKERPLIKINCGAIPQGVVESELFGHEKGAFTGAIQKRIGRFELADKGTLFMDEVGELPLDTQVKLLRVLQEQEFERVGSTRPIKVDVRLVAATNRELDTEVAEGRFRADLFYRLNVFPIRIPPLRERPGDIPLLVDYFLVQFQRKMGKPLRSVTPSSMQQLQRYAWPGNIRELQNVLERACVLATGPDVSIGDSFRATTTPVQGAPPSASPVQTLEESERAHIRRALAAAGGRVHGANGAAELLGINPSTLRSRMQKLGISTRG